MESPAELADLPFGLAYLLFERELLGWIARDGELLLKELELPAPDGQCAAGLGNAYSARRRPLIPIEGDHPFRSKATTVPA
jgi:hypothetical protein